MSCRSSQGGMSTCLATLGRLDGGHRSWHGTQRGARTEAEAELDAVENDHQSANSGDGDGHSEGTNGVGAPDGGTIPSEAPGTACGSRAARADSAPVPPLSLRVAYSIGGGKRTCKGIEVGKEGFAKYVSERIEPRRTDAEGMRMVEQVLDRVEASGFKAPALDRMRVPARIPAEPWRAGEALAECYLVDYECASFPYPRLRDERNPYASSTGPDLVGYVVHCDSVTFLFGEVKTTGAEARPPGVVHDLRIQLEPLLSGQGTMHLVHYLIKKAETGSDGRGRERNDEALKSYAACRWTTAGILISDQYPDEIDLRAAFARLEKSARSGAVQLRLVALYVPVPIVSLGKPAEGGA